MHLQLLQKPVYEARGLAAAPSYYLFTCNNSKLERYSDAIRWIMGGFPLGLYSAREYVFVS